jgi:hypothetical protein
VPSKPCISSSYTNKEATAAATIQSNAVEGSMLNNDVISAQTALTTGLASTDELAVSDAGTLKRMDVSVLQTYMQNNLTFTSNTDVDVNVSNLTARLPQITESVTIGDATDVTVTTSGNLVVTGNMTINGTTTTVSTTNTVVSDSLIELSNGTSTATIQSGNGRGSSNAVASFYWDIHSYNVNTYDTIIRITTTGNNNQGIVALIEEI